MIAKWGRPLVVGIFVIAMSIHTSVKGQQAGAITGIVVCEEDPSGPVRRAVVTATGPALTASRSAVSDDEGRFSITGLPAGSYSVFASRSTFVTSAYGALRPARLGTPVLVAANLPATGLRLRMWRGAVLAGSVRNERGDPIEGLSVRALPLKPNAANYLSLTNNGVATDEEGRFRIFGLEPGQYVVTTTPSFAGGLASAALRDEYVDAVLRDLRAGGRGTPVRTSVTVEQRPQAVLYSSVYFPGTARPDEAAPITVTAGQVVDGLNFTLIQVPAVSVSGSVVLPDGTPAAGAEVRLAASQAGRGGLAPTEVRYAAISGASGAFNLQHVPAGAFEVTASLRVDRSPRTGGGTRETTTLWGTNRLDMVGAPVAGLVIQLAQGLRIEGRVRTLVAVDGLPAGFDEVRVAAIPGSTSNPRTLRGSATPPITRDGTFVISDLRPNSVYRLILDGIPSGWWPESAIVAGADWLDGPLTLTAERIQTSVTVTLTDRPTRLQGMLEGQPLVGNVFIVALPANRALWGSERRVRAVQPDARGGYEFVNLPSGEYLIGAIGDVDPDDWRDREFLEKVAQGSVAVTLARGEARRLDLRTK